MTNRNATLSDIAAVAGVSKSTVSRVLTGSKPVDAETAQRVRAALAELRYRPNAMARGLAKGRSLAVGVLVQNLESPFYGQLLQGIEQGLDLTPFRPVIASTSWRMGHPDEETRSVEMLLEQRVDGLLVLGGRVPDGYLRDLAEELPVVVVERIVEGIEERCLAVDNRAAAAAVVRYLLGLGHTRIAHITGPRDHPTARARLAGYRDAFAEVDLEVPDDLVLDGDFAEESGQLAAQRLLGRGRDFTAVFAANDQMAYGALLPLHAHGLRVPADVSIVGFDDLPFSAYTSPPLTTMRQPAHAMGGIAARMLLAQIEGHPVEPEPVRTELVIRSSAGAAPRARSAPARGEDFR